MHLANPLRLGTFGLLAILFTQTATAEWLDRLLRPAALEELVAPANEPHGAELPPLPEPLPPSATEESVLEPPEFSDESPVSPYDRGPYEMERPSTAPAPIPWQVGPDQHACCEEPRIKYWNHPLLAKDHCSCHNTEEITILLTVPTDCCSVEVPVCITACCDSVPEFDSSRDLLGRKTYEYCWPCGQRVKIVDRHTGTLVVHTYHRE